MNIILCGLPASGKTTLGKQLAAKINYVFIDTDRMIEDAYAAQTGRHYTCRQICQEEGERKFRELENQQIASLKVSERMVIAIGGGTLEDLENVAILQKIGRVIYLRTPIDILWNRICLRGIPAYLDPKNPEKAFYETAKRRIPLFEKAANDIIETTNLSEQDLLMVLLNRTLTNGN